MNVVINVDSKIVVMESCTHNYLCIYVNLCQKFKIIRSLRKFVCRYLIVCSIKPVNIFLIGQILHNSQQNIDFKNFVIRYCSLGRKFCVQ